MGLSSDGSIVELSDHAGLNCMIGMGDVDQSVKAMPCLQRRLQ